MGTRFNWGLAWNQKADYVWTGCVLYSFHLDFLKNRWQPMSSHVCKVNPTLPAF